MNINSVILGGRLTRDPSVKYTQGGTAVADLGLAVNRSWFDKASNQKREETTFVDAQVWGASAEACGEHLRKGATVVIEGRLQLDTWTDKQSGQNRSKLRVVANQVHFGSRPQGRDGGHDRTPPSQASEMRPADEYFHPPAPADSPSAPPNDEVPF